MLRKKQISFGCIHCRAENRSLWNSKGGVRVSPEREGGSEVFVLFRQEVTQWAQNNLAFWWGYLSYGNSYLHMSPSILICIPGNDLYKSQWLLRRLLCCTFPTGSFPSFLSHTAHFAWCKTDLGCQPALVATASKLFLCWSDCRYTWLFYHRHLWTCEV